ncbi:MAG: MFS transporter [Mesorhizobium sp.]|uniref:MFS transporter n=1 Tax=unclassified Mesorhizobium TaxID=325217 RepID=UPI000F754853|nr:MULTISPECIES: MFS transporter [unclassified Mesorhizobium]TGV93684.1 MFS transporter [Mesorhizobium sp. M00.F.Ca.ET.158.01.1.1]AZO63406.1 MFS transporter [Mesorhizobium sp. M1A.F.Ca.IN.022.06.1.1]MCT2580757.1 MFS transporter [Mesorhizobium sp. P13.3]MDF3169700.1 MFS transporter [Mesorhizobium sp. P16.1]MDF3179448.1 MFS transporter [Mesorhizobium sp. P17.1]
MYAARACRDFGDGFAAVLLPVYLASIGFGPLEIGVVATAALLGSALLTLGIGFLAVRADRRTLLLAASGLMIATGVAYTQSSTYAAVLLVAFLGTINPSSGSVSIFVPLEHAVLSRLVADTDRTEAFARHSLLGALAAAFGALAATSPDFLVTIGIARLTALKAMFFLYAVLGVAGGLVYARIPAGPKTSPQDRPAAALGPSRAIVYKLAALFSIDAFAGGFAVQSLIALWLFSRFGLSLSTAGVFFFWSGVLSAVSFPVAAWLSRRIGLVNTMVFTHIPSSICLILAALEPNLYVSLAFLLVRAALSQMDVPTRSSYVMAVVTPPERPAAASVTSVPRSLAAAASPAIAGALFAEGFEAWPLVICGALKILYDLALLWAFRHIKPPEES